MQQYLGAVHPGTYRYLPNLTAVMNLRNKGRHHRTTLRTRPAARSCSAVRISYAVSLPCLRLRTILVPIDWRNSIPGIVQQPRISSCCITSVERAGCTLHVIPRLSRLISNRCGSAGIIGVAPRGCRALHRCRPSRHFVYLVPSALDARFIISETRLTYLTHQLTCRPSRLYR